ncbi:hypothetical protein WN943_001379 [Citrus x changshan-huyou]
MDKGKGLADEYFNEQSIDYSGNEEVPDEFPKSEDENDVPKTTELASFIGLLCRTSILVINQEWRKVTPDLKSRLWEFIKCSETGLVETKVDRSAAWKCARKIKNNEYDLDVELVVKKIDALEEKAKKGEFKAGARNDILARSIGKPAISAHMQGVGKFISPKMLIRKDPFTIPFIDQMLEKLAGKSHFCCLDGYSGFHQIPVAPEDQEKTTFTCPFGTFAYRRMPFGLCNAPGTFQRCMVSNEACKVAFDKLKELVTSTPIIQPPD